MLDINAEFKGDQLFDGHYRLLRTLSTDGATADVWLALDENTVDKNAEEIDESSGMLVAIKIYRPKNALDIEGEQRFRDEYMIAHECRHPNLLPPEGFSIFEGMPYLVLPYCEAGSSEQLIGKNHTVNEIWKFISDVASGLDRLHSNQPQIIHQDIKPANILIDNNDNFTITDFGISSKTSGSHGSYYDDENSGTFAYMAPERFADNPIPLPESDIWAFGATLYEILTTQVPFGENGGKSQKENTPLPELSGLPANIKNLIHACLQFNPQKRPTARQIIQAAQTKHYPPKRKAPLYITLCFVGCLLVGAAVYFLTAKDDNPIPSQKSIEEIFEIALKQMNANDKDSLIAGYRLMDSLSDIKYVPALYEMAFTCGWYDDTASINRKKLLGIKTTEDGFPDSMELNIKVKSLFIDILKKCDSTDPLLNANAAYHLASYYGDKRAYDNDKTKVEYDIALKYLETSKNWASIAEGPDKDSLLTRIDNTIEIIYKIMQNQKNNE